jgi:hypothetical protein
MARKTQKALKNQIRINYLTCQLILAETSKYEKRFLKKIKNVRLRNTS